MLVFAVGDCGGGTEVTGVWSLFVDLG